MQKHLSFFFQKKHRCFYILQMIFLKLNLSTIHQKLKYCIILFYQQYTFFFKILIYIIKMQYFKYCSISNIAVFQFKQIIYIKTLLHSNNFEFKTFDSLKMIYQKYQKYLTTQQQKLKYKKQCLKSKNILFQNQTIQIGCKIQTIYDFYMSESYAVVGIFVGNNGNKPLQNFKIQYKGTDNLQVWIEQKEKIVREKTQIKQRLIINCTNFNEEIFLAMDFISDSMTFKAAPIPLTMYSFFSFLPLEQTFSTNIQRNLQKFYELFNQKYEYMEDSSCNLNSEFFKKNIEKQFDKYMSKINKLTSKQNQTLAYAGVLALKKIVEDIGIVIEININTNKLKITLASNEYKNFQSIFGNFSFIFEG